MIFETQITEHVNELIGGQPEPKRSDMQMLHSRISVIMPGCKLWFDDGKDEEGKVVTNPTIGYGLQTLKYANGKTRDFFQIGLCANKAGISVYILGIADKTYLAKTYSKDLGKASITGYCIKFNKLADINLGVIEEAILYGVELTKKNLLTRS